jgi:hypothetical protein
MNARRFVEMGPSSLRILILNTIQKKRISAGIKIKYDLKDS